jgi:L-type amino acid transporter 9
MQTAGQDVLGRSGAVIFALLVSVACLGSIHINVFTTARLTISAVSKGYLPKLLAGDSHSQNGQPQDRQLQDAPLDRSLFSKLLNIFGVGPFWQTPMWVQWATIS